MQRRRPNSLSTPKIYYVGADPKKLKISGSAIAEDHQGSEIKEQKKGSPDKLFIRRKKKDSVDEVEELLPPN